MDDFTISNLHASRDEWCARLVNILTPLIIEGLKSIFNEAWKMSVENDEASKYLMTFQNLLCRVPKWNALPCRIKQIPYQIHLLQCHPNAYVSIEQSADYLIIQLQIDVLYP